MFDHFDVLAPVYERLISPPDRETMRRYLQPAPEMNLLDVGGGTGRVAQVLRDDFASIVIADLSAGMLKQARARGLDCVWAQSERLPFSAAFDRVLMVDAFHHVIEQAETARDMFRALKPGGLLVIQEPDIHRWVVKLIAVLEKMALMRSHFMAAEAIGALFAGLPAEVRWYREGHQAWVLVRRLPEEQGAQDARISL